MNDESGKFETRWIGFTGAIYKLIQVRLGMPGAFFKPFREFVDDTFQHLRSEHFLHEMERIWISFQGEPDTSLEAGLLEMEIRAFEAGYEAVTGQKSSDPNVPPPSKEWKSKAHTAKQMLRVAQTIVNSILDALAQFLPRGMSGLLKVLDEAIGIVT